MSDGPQESPGLGYEVGAGPQGQQEDISQPTAPVDSGGHPAWQEILGAVPEMFHPQIRPTLEKWDRGVQDKLDSMRGEWEDYQFLKENQVDAQTVNYALNILGALQNDPRGFYDSIAQYYEFEKEQQQQQQPGMEDYEGYQQQPQVDPRIEQMQQQMEVLAKALYEQRTKDQEALEDQALERELSTLRQKYGDYDETYVLSLMAAGQDGESAVRAYKELEGRARGQATPQPQILGSGGGAPASGMVDPRKLSDKDTKSLVSQMLERAQQGV